MDFGGRMKRREFLGVLGGLTVCRSDTNAQPAPPVIGYLSTLSEAQVAPQTAAFRRGLAEVGFSEGKMLPSTSDGPKAGMSGFPPWPRNWWSGPLH